MIHSYLFNEVNYARYYSSYRTDSDASRVFANLEIQPDVGIWPQWTS